MAENKESSDEKLLILPLGEESKKITQVISNDTARQIIELLADIPLSASDIAERLNTPLTTITYNLENLESVGLVKIERIKYSEKGREMKIYAPVRKLIVVVPEKTDRTSVTDILKKYLGVVFAAALASSLIEFFVKSRNPRIIVDMSLNEKVASSSFPLSNATSDTVMNGTAMVSESQKSFAANATVTKEFTQATPAVSVPLVPFPKKGAEPDIISRITESIIAHPGLIFLLGCLFVIFLLILVEYFRKRKNN